MIHPKPLDWAPFREAFPTILRWKACLNAEEHHHDLVWGLFAALEAIALRQMESGEEPLAIREVKSKYGGLRFDADNATPEADDLMTEAENRSDPPEGRPACLAAQTRVDDCRIGDPNRHRSQDLYWARTERCQPNPR